MKKMNPFKWFLVFVALIAAIMLSSCDSSKGPNTGFTTKYRVIDGIGYAYDVDTIITSPVPNCIIVQGTYYNAIVCGNYTIIAKKQ